MNMLTQELVMQKYLTFDYRIRYLTDGARPLPVPEPGTVFALENGLGHGLVCDPLNRPLIFNTEEEAFSIRKRLGLVYPVLVFHEGEPEASEFEMTGVDSLDVSTATGLKEYLGERP
jgi:hypothetical protein